MIMNVRKLNIFFLILCIFFPLYLVIAFDEEYFISPTGNSFVYFSTWSAQTKYYNKDANSDIIGNYLSGSYYSTTYGYFDFIDVRFVGSTNTCSTGYGYKLSGKAKSLTAWYIDFWYNKNTFVYYCMNDNKLYGKAYIPAVWEQIFDGINFEIRSNRTLPNIPSENSFFVNNNTLIFYNTPEQEQMKYGQESIFYIWKPKKK